MAWLYNASIISKAKWRMVVRSLLNYFEYLSQDLNFTYFESIDFPRRVTSFLSTGNSYVLRNKFCEHAKFSDAISIIKLI